MLKDKLGKKVLKNVKKVLFFIQMSITKRTCFGLIPIQGYRNGFLPSQAYSQIIVRSLE